MSEDSQFRYDRMVERALRGVVREALERVASSGLLGKHHFYITFATRHPQTQLPAYLVDRYAEEMTIVLQFQFSDLEVTEERFSVTLSFGGKPERLVIPFAAIKSFADPSVSFALQFQPRDLSEELPAAPEPAAAPAPADADPQAGAKVVTLDSFRKK